MYNFFVSNASLPCALCFVFLSIDLLNDDQLDAIKEEALEVRNIAAQAVEGNVEEAKRLEKRRSEERAEIAEFVEKNDHKSLEKDLRTKRRSVVLNMKVSYGGFVCVMSFHT